MFRFVCFSTKNFLLPYIFLVSNIASKGFSWGDYYNDDNYNFEKYFNIDEKKQQVSYTDNKLSLHSSKTDSLFFEMLVSTGHGNNLLFFFRTGQICSYIFLIFYVLSNVLCFFLLFKKEENKPLELGSYKVSLKDLLLFLKKNIKLKVIQFFSIIGVLFLLFNSIIYSSLFYIITYIINQTLFCFILGFVFFKGFIVFNNQDNKNASTLKIFILITQFIIFVLCIVKTSEVFKIFNNESKILQLYEELNKQGKEKKSNLFSVQFFALNIFLISHFIFLMFFIIFFVLCLYNLCFFTHKKNQDTFIKKNNTHKKNTLKENEKKSHLKKEADEVLKKTEEDFPLKKEKNLPKNGQTISENKDKKTHTSNNSSNAKKKSIDLKKENDQTVSKNNLVKNENEPKVSPSVSLLQNLELEQNDQHILSNEEFNKLLEIKNKVNKGDKLDTNLMKDIDDLIRHIDDLMKNIENLGKKDKDIILDILVLNRNLKIKDWKTVSCWNWKSHDAPEPYKMNYDEFKHQKFYIIEEISTGKPLTFPIIPLKRTDLQIWVLKNDLLSDYIQNGKENPKEWEAKFKKIISDKQDK